MDPLFNALSNFLGLMMLKLVSFVASFGCANAHFTTLTIGVSRFKTTLRGLYLN
jgi:hypothetical protein